MPQSCYIECQKSQAGFLTSDVTAFWCSFTQLAKISCLFVSISQTRGKINKILSREFIVKFQYIGGTIKENDMLHMFMPYI